MTYTKKLGPATRTKAPTKAMTGENPNARVVHRGDARAAAHGDERTRAMGITFAKLFQRLFSKKEMRILMVRRARCPWPLARARGRAPGQIATLARARSQDVEDIARVRRARSIA